MQSRRDTSKPDAIRVGMCASLSGQFAVQGTQALHGVMAWVEDTNRRGGVFVRELSSSLPISFTHYDDRSRAADARELVRNLVVHDEVHLLLGPYSSGLTMAAAQVAEEMGVVLWNHGGSADSIHQQGFRWTVNILSPAGDYLTGVPELVLQTNPAAERLAIVHSSTGAFSRSVAQGAAEKASELGIELVFQETFDSPATDFSQLLELVEASTPDLLVGVGRIEDDLLLAQQLPISIEAMVALAATPIEQFRNALGARCDGFVGPSQWEASAKLNIDYGPNLRDITQQLGQQPDYPMAQGYAGGLVAQRCIEETGSLDQAALRQAASALDFTTFYGRFKLDATGRQVGHQVLLVQWQRGRKIIVWPPQLAQALPVG